MEKELELETENRIGTRTRTFKLIYENEESLKTQHIGQEGRQRTGWH